MTYFVNNAISAVDDEDYLITEGIQYGFDVIAIKPDGLNWAEKVLLKAEQIKKRKSS